jgi:hypothetical protein
MTRPLRLIVLWFGVSVGSFGGTNAFFSPTTTTTTQVSFYSALNMAPRYDKQSQQWFPTDPSIEGPEAGYNIIGSLYRAGPVPFIQRIINANSYEQAVLKYMAQEKCDRITAQGNMDAYLENPQDWAYQKMQEKNNGVTPKDYANANMQPRQIILSSVWAIVVIAFGYDLITGVTEGRYGQPDGNTNDLFHGNLWTLPF